MSKKPVTKLCIQCGELKNVSEFRQYYGGRKGTYRMCKACESINYRVKYLLGLKIELKPEQKKELEDIYSLWELQRSMGLMPPDWNIAVPKQDDLRIQLLEIKTKAASLPQTVIDALGKSSPHIMNPRTRLYYWATVYIEQDADPDLYLETVYNNLTTMYRPQIGIDPATRLPVYDETYKPVLEYILDRFYKYEDEYNKRQED